MWANFVRMMPLNKTLLIVVIGAGGVASALAPALDALDGVEVVQIFSRSLDRAISLATRLSNAQAIDSLSDTAAADLYLIAVKDDAIADVVSALPPVDQESVVAHTSGSVGIDVLSISGCRTGVFYPLQTFSPGREVNVGSIPFFIEGCDAATTGFLKQLAFRMSGRVYDADGDTRRLMHVAAVFACNFTNHLWAIAADLLAVRGIPFDVLSPLLEETLHKAFTASPSEGQTGPARRGDTRVMDAHRKMLDDCQARIYDLISQSIMQRYDTLRSDKDTCGGV